MFVVVLSGCHNDDLTVDMTNTVTDTNAPPVNFPAEIARAKKEKKMLLVEFGSSDTCPPCVKLQQSVFSTATFQDYERSNLVFVRLDFPQKHYLRGDTQATNYILAEEFNVGIYPTFVGSKDGVHFWKMESVTMQQFNPTNFISELEDIRKK
ncbi:MAG TPA: thioredoxin family protein [Verrucomicrobiae bacterium]